MEKNRLGRAIPPADMYANRLASLESAKRWRLEQRSATAVNFLSRNGFEAHFVPNEEEARAEVIRRIPPNATIGAGGSITIRQLGVLEALEQAGHMIYDHWRPGLSQEEILSIRRAQLTCDVFLSSVNALTLQGQLVSTDGVGNRLAAMTFGPSRVFLVVGANKIVANLASALQRLRSVCAPLALRETGAALPCAQTGICGSCQSDSRLCRATLILDCKPLQTNMTVLVVGAELGF